MTAPACARNRAARGVDLFTGPAGDFIERAMGPLRLPLIVAAVLGAGLWATTGRTWTGLGAAFGFVGLFASLLMIFERPAQDRDLERSRP